MILCIVVASIVIQWFCYPRDILDRPAIGACQHGVSSRPRDRGLRRVGMHEHVVFVGDVVTAVNAPSY